MLSSRSERYGAEVLRSYGLDESLGAGAPGLGFLEPRWSGGDWGSGDTDESTGVAPHLTLTREESAPPRAFAPRPQARPSRPAAPPSQPGWLKFLLTILAIKGGRYRPEQAASASVVRPGPTPRFVKEAF